MFPSISQTVGGRPLRPPKIPSREDSSRRLVIRQRNALKYGIGQLLQPPSPWRIRLNLFTHNTLGIVSHRPLRGVFGRLLRPISTGVL